MTALVIFKDGNHLIHPFEAKREETAINIPEWVDIVNPFSRIVTRVFACGLNKKCAVYKEW